MTPVVVAGGFQTAVVLMRSLWRRGIQVHAVDSNSNQPVFHTVYGKPHLCPDADSRPDEWREFMIALSAQIGGQPVLISSSDKYVTAIAAHADALEPHFRFCQSSIASQALLATKKRQYAIADELGLPVPATRFIQSPDDVRAFAATATFPIILKPLHFREWKLIAPNHPLFEKKLIVIATPEELERQYLLASKINPQMVVQEMIEGPDVAKMVYLSCYDRNSRRIASCMVRQMRTDPIYFGSASVVEPIADPEADRLCDEFLRKLKYYGLCEIELKRDSRDGRVKMIEANPRFSVTADAAYYAGVDLGWIHYLDLIGQTPEPVFPDGRFFRHIALFRDVACFHSYISAGLLTWGGFLRSYTGRVFYFDFDRRDARLTARNVMGLIRVLLGSMIRSVFPGFRRPS